MKSHFNSDITPREEFCYKVADIVANKRNNEYGDPMEVIEKTFLLGVETITYLHNMEESMSV